MITFRKDAGETAKVQNEACLGCPRRGVQTYWEASPHASRGIACVNCHTLMEKINRYSSKDYGVDIMRLSMGNVDSGTANLIFLGDRGKGAYEAHVGFVGVKLKF